MCAWLPPNEYATLGAAYRACDRLNQAAAVCAANGLRLGVHNHWFEFQPLGDSGVRPYEIWLEPVSYTHLDVYKRQVGRPGGGAAWPRPSLCRSGP